MPASSAQVSRVMVVATEISLEFKVNLSEYRVASKIGEVLPKHNTKINLENNNFKLDCHFHQ